jgi:large subunit ribosomal protein L4
MYRGAIKSIFSELARQGRLKCIDTFQVEQAKTKLAIELLSSLKLDNVLVITDDVSSEIFMATRNIPMVDVIDTSEIEPYSLIGYKEVLMTQAAVEKVEAWLG